MPRPPSTPVARLQFSQTSRGLRLEQALYAAQRPPRGVEIMQQDAYFARVEALLDELS